MYQKNVKESNENKVFEYIFNSENNFVINEIADKLDMSFPTAKRVLMYFLDKNIIAEEDKVGHGVGRKAREYSFNKAFCYSLGVQITEKTMKIVLVNAKGTIIKTHPDKRIKNESNIVDELIANIETFQNKLSKDMKKKTIGIGISIPGIVNHEGKFIEFTLNHRTNINEIKKLQNHFKIPVLVENESNLSSVAEAFLGENSKVSNFTTLTINNYVGTSFFQRDKDQIGFHFKAGKMHNMIINADNKKQCWGEYVSNSALQSAFKKQFTGIKKYEDIFNEENLKTKEGKEILANYIKYLAVGIKNILFFSNPEKVIISGAICNYQEFIKENLLNEIYKEDVFYRGKETIAFSPFNENSSLIGAAIFPIVDTYF